MMFGVANLLVDKKINTKYVGSTTVKDKKFQIYQINVGEEKLFVSLVKVGKIPLLYVSSDFDLLVKQLKRLENDKN